MEGWEKWGPVCGLFNVPRSKYPRKEAVDYELVYSISTASMVMGNLVTAEDTRRHRGELPHWACSWGHTEDTRWHAESQSHPTVQAFLWCHMRPQSNRKQPNKTTGKWEYCWAYWWLSFMSKKTWILGVPSFSQVPRHLSYHLQSLAPRWIYNSKKKLQFHKVSRDFGAQGLTWLNTGSTRRNMGLQCSSDTSMLVAEWQWIKDNLVTCF